MMKKTMPFQLLILTYHRILPTPSAGAVAAPIFTRQLEYLTKRQWQFITASELAAIWAGRLSPPGERLIMLTFDDGWADNRFYADPILARFQLRATLAVNTSLVNPEDRLRSHPANLIPSKAALELAVYGRGWDSFLTWPELAELRGFGRWELQAHGNSHLGTYRDLTHIKGFFPSRRHWTMEYALGEPPFTGAPAATFCSILAAPRTRLAPELAAALKRPNSNEGWRKLCQSFSNPVVPLETDAEFQRRIREDLMSCRDLLREKLQVNATVMFWPWGHDSEASIAAAKECGFELLMTMDKDAVTSPDQRWRLPRIAAPETYFRFRRRIAIFSRGPLRWLRRWFSR